MEISIYVWTDANPFRADRCRAAYQLTAYLEEREPASKGESFSIEEATLNGATLEALATALSRLKEGRELNVTVICPAPHVICSINQRQYEKWEDNGWKNSKGEPVKNLVEWQLVAKMIKSKLSGRIEARAPSKDETDMIAALGGGYYMPHAENLNQ